MCPGYAWRIATLTYLYEQLGMHLILTRINWAVMRHWFRYETIQIISNHMLHSIMLCIKYFIINMIELRRHGFMSTSRAWEEGILIPHMTRYSW